MVNIYTITNTRNGKVYVGQTLMCKKRFRQHVYGLNKGRHPNRHLLSAWKQDGEMCFVFAMHSQHETQVEANAAEIALIAKWQSEGLCYNILVGGEGEGRTPWNKGRKLPHLSGENSSRFGKHFSHSDKVKAKISAASIARGSTPPSSLGRKMPPRPQEWRDKQSRSMMGKFVTEETRRKKSEALKGKPWSEKRKQAFLDRQGLVPKRVFSAETREKMRMSRIAYLASHPKQ